MTFVSRNPATGDVVWAGPAADASEVDRVIRRVREGSGRWSSRPLEDRVAILRSFAGVLGGRKEELAALISREVGKPLWEARTEVQSMIGKVELSVKAWHQRCAEFSGGGAVTRFRPHGVVAVLGPFNFPGHLPNGHIVPALLAGNAVVFKPSERAPAVAEATAAAWREAGVGEDVLSVVQGGREAGAAVASNPGIDGLFFTGSSGAGLRLAEQFAATPERILALEMGGNNPLVVWRPRDLEAAAALTVQSAFLTAGQRCTCARRLIVPEGGEGEAFLAALVRRAGRLRVGDPADRPEPFMGPVIGPDAAEAVLRVQAELEEAGGRVLMKARRLKPGTGLLSPALIDVTGLARRRDEEIFGPLLQVIRVGNFGEAIAEANRTRFGLAAGLIDDDADRYGEFRRAVRAGVVNWNHPLTGASGAAPFGGVGRSGNHRPSGFFAADYCAFPVASLETAELRAPAPLPGMGDEA